MSWIYFIAGAEKFALNGIRSMMLVYLLKSGIGQKEAFLQTTTFLALSYLLPLAIGIIKDHVKSFSDSLLIPLTLLSCVPILKTIYPVIDINLVLSSILIVSAVFKVMVPIWIDSDGSNNKNAFTIMYTAFNWGTLIGTLLLGTVAETFGWSISFLLSGLSLLFAVVLAYKKKKISFNKFSSLFTISILLSMTFLFLKIYLAFDKIMDVILILGIAYITRLFFKYGKNLIEIIDFYILMIVHTLFFSIYEQTSTSFVAFASEIFKSGNIPLTTLQNFDPIFNIIIGTMLVYIPLKGKSLSFSKKFIYGMIITCIGALVLGLASKVEIPLVLIGIFILSTIFFVFAELLMVPTGFQLATQFSPINIKGNVIGVWYLSIAYSEKIAAKLGSTLLTDQIQNKSLIYNTGITKIAFFCILVSFVLLIWTGIKKILTKK